MSSPLFALPPEVLLCIVTVCLDHDKEAWDTLRCSCKALRELVGGCITTACVTPDSPMHLMGFPKHGLLKKLYLRGEPVKCGPVLVGTFKSFGTEAAAVAAMIPGPRSASTILSFLDVNASTATSKKLHGCTCWPVSERLYWRAIRL